MKFSDVKFQGDADFHLSKIFNRIPSKVSRKSFRIKCARQDERAQASGLRTPTGGARGSQVCPGPPTPPLTFPPSLFYRWGLWAQIGFLRTGLFFFFFFVFSRATSVTYGGSQTRGRIEAVAASLRQSHSNAGSQLRLQPTPQLMAMPDP